MKLYLAVFAIWISTVSAVSISGLVNSLYTFKQTHQDPNDQGQLLNCGASEGGSDFKFTWTPRVITANKKYVLTLSGKASRDFTSGTANVTIWVSGTPAFSQEKKVTCDEMLPYAKGLLKCPVKAGDTINIPSFGMVAPKETSQVPAGTYTVMITITDQNGKVFVCAKGDITIGG